MNTPTPLTDEAWSSAFNAEDFSASSVARSMRVFSQKIEIELAAANEACRVASEDALLMRDDLYKQLAAATTERDQLRAELAAERGKLDWVFENYVVEAKDFRRGNRYVYYLDNREDLIVEMKEDAK